MNCEPTGIEAERTQRPCAERTRMDTCKFISFRRECKADVGGMPAKTQKHTRKPEQEPNIFVANCRRLSDDEGRVLCINKEVDSPMQSLFERMCCEKARIALRKSCGFANLSEPVWVRNAQHLSCKKTEAGAASMT